MGGERASWALLALGVVGTGLWACQTPEEQTSDLPEELVLGVLDAVGPSVVQPHLDAYDTSLQALTVAVDAWAAGADRAGVYAAFDDTMAAWQRVDVLRVAPAEGVDPLLLRDNQYSWPLTNPCRVDQVTASGEYDALDTQLVNAKGLDALAHLLYAGEDNACPSQVPPNSDGAWDALDADAIDAERAAYAQAITAQLSADLAAYEAAWATPAVPSLQAVVDGLFALETVIKDDKLGVPLGITDCSGDDCIDRVEGVDANPSTRWISENLTGFRALFTAGDATGIDDLLAELGEPAVSDELLRLTDEAIAQADALDSNLTQAILTDEAGVVALYETVDAIDEVLRADVVPLLMLQLPAEVGGDVD